jgi:putative ABC transport system permease protein
MEPHRRGHRSSLGSLVATACARCSAFWRNIVHRPQVDDELNEELQSQLELLVDEHVSRGASRTEAERLARLEFGGVEQVKEHVRAVRTGHWLDGLVQDVRYGSRSLLRTPAMTLAAILTIALGVGVNTTSFLIVNGLVLRPFTVASGAPILSVTQRIEGEAARTRHVRFEQSWVAYREYAAYRQATQAFAGVAAYAPDVTATLAGDQPRSLPGVLASCNYFEVLEVQVAAGRGFLGTECAAPSASQVVVLSDSLWRTAFGSDPTVLGRSITLNRRLFTVIGIAPAGFQPPGPIASAFWAPVTAQSALIPNSNLLEDPQASWLAVLARPRPGIDLRAARAELTVIAADLDRQESSRHTRLVVAPAAMFDMPQARTAALGLGSVLLGAVALVLLVACANVANMLLARSAARRREIAVRLALGASRARLVRQLLTETLLVTIAGAGAGAILATWTAATLLHVLTKELARYIPIPPLTVAIGPDWHLLVYTSAMTLVTAVVCGLLPAIRASQSDVCSDLKQESGESALHGRALGWWRQLLLGCQMLVSMVLLLVTGLLLHGLYHAETVDPGFQTRDIYVVRYDLAAAGYDLASAARIQQRLLDRVSAHPGLATAQVWVTPLDGATLGQRFVLSDGSDHFGSWNVVSPGYFAVLGLPILRGRAFTAVGEHEGGGVAIVSESTARRFWANVDPIGQVITYRRGPQAPREVHTVVGVVKDAQVGRLGESDSTFVYVPATARDEQNLVLLVRQTDAAGPVGDMTTELRTIVREVDPQLVAAVSALEDNLRLWRSLSRLAVSVTGLLAGLALALAVVGAYGLVAYTVSRRTREIGIRMALGATKREVTRLVLQQTMMPVIAAAVVGLICGAVASRALSAVLFGLSPYDPLSFAVVPIVLITIAAVATYGPIRRAARVDPMVALRYE